MKVAADTIDQLIQRSPRPDDLAAIDELISDAAPELKRQLFTGPTSR